MVKKIYLEESVDRASLKAFVARVFKLSGLHLTVYNERGEAVVGNHEEVLGGPVEPADLAGFSDGGIMARPDGNFLKVVKLEWRGHIYGAVLIGPYGSASGGPADGRMPRITGDQLDAV
ncbi:MAG TPA: hypothetical protein PLU72_19470, partial [Candidatus Ozemobacteraceae bacterium]|nr:hypothetical protein [Candidatus Ozemobacteraceae bacterium]